MTATFKLASVPMAVIILAAGFFFALPVLVPDLPQINLPAPVPAYSAVEYIPVSGNHNPEHDVQNNIEAAKAVITAYNNMATGGGGPNSNQTVRCVIMKVGAEAARFILWSQTKINPISGIARGVVLIWHANPPAGTDPFVGVYGDKSANTLLKVPGDITDPTANMEERNCSNFPPPPALPQ